MSNPSHLQPSFYVVDVGDVLERYHLEHLINQLFPQITLQGLVAIVLSASDGPGHDEAIVRNIEKWVGEKFEVLPPEDIQSIELLALEICEMVDSKIRMISAFQNHGTAYFWKWLDPRTLVLAHHHDPLIQQQIQFASHRAMENYIHSSANFLRR